MSTSEAKPHDTKTHVFMNPYLRAADKSHQLHTGYPLVAVADAETVITNEDVRERRKHSPAVLHRARRRAINQFFNRLIYANPKLFKTSLLGVIVFFMYTILYVNERAVLEMSVSSWWSPLVPITIALLFSLAHGNFTAAFWDTMGLKPNTVRK